MIDGEVAGFTLTVNDLLMPGEVGKAIRINSRSDDAESLRIPG